jgi:hypothetical protein
VTTSNPSVAGEQNLPLSFRIMVLTSCTEARRHKQQSYVIGTP